MEIPTIILNRHLNPNKPTIITANAIHKQIQLGLNKKTILQTHRTTNRTNHRIQYYITRTVYRTNLYSDYAASCLRLFRKCFGFL